MYALNDYKVPKISFFGFTCPLSYLFSAKRYLVVYVNLPVFVSSQSIPSWWIKLELTIQFNFKIGAYPEMRHKDCILVFKIL